MAREKPTPKTLLMGAGLLAAVIVCGGWLQYRSTITLAEQACQTDAGYNAAQSSLSDADKALAAGDIAKADSLLDEGVLKLGSSYLRISRDNPVLDDTGLKLSLAHAPATAPTVAAHIKREALHDRIGMYRVGHKCGPKS